MKSTKNYFELIVGTAVLICAAIFLFSSTKKTDMISSSGYILSAKFDNISGIGIGTDVKISGIKIGEVQSQTLDKDTFRADIKVKIGKNFNIPDDSSIRVATEGLLGQKYLEIQPGGSEKNLSENSEIMYTQSSINLEDLLGKFIFGSEKKSEDQTKTQ